MNNPSTPSCCKRWYSGYRAVYRKELLTAYTNPFTAIFLIVFDALALAMMFGMGAFFDRNQADLGSLFQFLPWLLMVFVPAWGMRMWAEERRQGTMELLLAAPISSCALIMAKYMASLTIIILALVGTLPAWGLITWLGNPDPLTVLSGYFGVVLLAAVMLALTSALSVRSDNQVSVFVLGVLINLVLMVTGASLVLNYMRPWANAGFVDLLAYLSLLSHFGYFEKGLIDLRSLFYTLALIGFGLYATALGLEKLRR